MSAEQFLNQKILELRAQRAAAEDTVFKTAQEAMKLQKQFEEQTEREREAKIALRTAWSSFQEIVLELKDVQTPSNRIAIRCNNIAVDAQVRLQPFFEEESRQAPVADCSMGCNCPVHTDNYLTCVKHGVREDTCPECGEKAQKVLEPDPLHWVPQEGASSIRKGCRHSPEKEGEDVKASQQLGASTRTVAPTGAPLSTADLVGAPIKIDSSNSQSSEPECTCRGLMIHADDCGLVVAEREKRLSSTPDKAVKS